MDSTKAAISTACPADQGWVVSCSGHQTSNSDYVMWSLPQQELGKLIIEAILVKKGHQDDTVPYAVLSATAKHNVEDADALATLYRDNVLWQSTTKISQIPS